jgi:hypothetical protein
MRAKGSEVGGPEVVVAGQLELVLRPVRTYAADGRLTGGLTGVHALLVVRLAGPGVIGVFVPGLRMRVLPCRVLAHV